MSGTSYSYDPDGNQISASTPAVATAGTPLGPNSASGNLSVSHVGAPEAQPITTYSYDGLDRLSSVSAPGAGTSDSSAGQTPTVDLTNPHRRADQVLLLRLFVVVRP